MDFNLVLYFLRSNKDNESDFQKNFNNQYYTGHTTKHNCYIHIYPKTLWLLVCVEDMALTAVWPWV